MLNKLKIATSGKSGCGNTTVSALLAKRLNLRHINYTFHNMADEAGIPFKEFCLLVEQDSQYDLELDRKQIELTKEPGCVLGSRLAIWLLKDAHVKVYLDGPAEVRASRISRRENLDFKVAMREMMQRDERDRNRFLKLYNIDVEDYGFADLIINTEEHDPEFIIRIIANHVEKLEL